MEKEVPEIERKRLVKKRYIEEIDYKLNKPSIEYQDAYSLVRGFFSELLKLDYEFTYEELSEELNKIFLKSSLKKDIDDFLYDLSESEYSFEKSPDQSQGKEMLTRLKTLIISVINEEEIEEHKPSFFERLFGQAKPAQKTPEEKAVIKEEIPINTDMNVAETIETKTLNEDKEPKNDTQEGIEITEDKDLFRKKMFQDQQISNISSSTSDKNILLNFEDNISSPDASMHDKPALPSESHKDQKKKTTSSKPLQKHKRTTTAETVKTGDLLIEENIPDIVSIHELMEQSYMHLYNSRIDDAKQAYKSALNIYHKLGIEDKRMIYSELSTLFKKLANDPMNKA